MSEPIFDEQRVRDAYAWVGLCLDAYEEYVRIAWDLQCKRRDPDAPERVKPTEAMLEQLADCVGRFREHGRKARELVDGLARHLPCLAVGPVEIKFVKGSSWADAVVRLLETLAERSKDWTTFGDQDPDSQGYMIRVLTTAPTDVQGIRANLSIEAAKLRDRAAALGAYDRYAYVLMMLTPQSQRLLKLLLDHRGRTVQYETIERTLWPSAEVSARKLRARLTSAMGALREELQSSMFTDLRAGIMTDEGLGYRLK